MTCRMFIASSGSCEKNACAAESPKVYQLYQMYQKCARRVRGLRSCPPESNSDSLERFSQLESPAPTSRGRKRIHGQKNSPGVASYNSLRPNGGTFERRIKEGQCRSAWS